MNLIKEIGKAHGDLKVIGKFQESVMKIIGGNIGQGIEFSHSVQSKCTTFLIISISKVFELCTIFKQGS